GLPSDSRVGAARSPERVVGAQAARINESSPTPVCAMGNRWMQTRRRARAGLPVSAVPPAKTVTLGALPSFDRGPSRYVHTRAAIGGCGSTRWAYLPPRLCFRFAHLRELTHRCCFAHDPTRDVALVKLTPLD